MTTDLYVDEEGCSDGPLVLFVHGALGAGRAFDRVGAQLGAEFKMLWYDRRGYGGSAGTDTDGVTVERHVEDVLDILDNRPAIVVGHSFGGVTAIGAAIRAPGLVRAVVAYETSMAWLPGWDDSVMQEIFSSSDPPDAGLRMMLGDRYWSLSDHDRNRRILDARAFMAEELSVRSGLPPYDVESLQVPLIYGRSHEHVMPVVVEHLKRHVRTLEIVTVPDAGHNAHRTAPEAFADLVRGGRQLALAGEPLES